MMTATMLALFAGLHLVRSRSSRSSKVGKTPLSAFAHSPRLGRITALPLLLIAVIALCVPGQRHISPSSVRPYHPESRVITAGIWTVHFSLDQGLWDSSRRMSQLIKEMELDVVGLLETDLHRTVFGNRDMTQYLSESLGMYADLGPGPDKHTWGAVLLSKVG
jgi:hypothetical protein